MFNLNSTELSTDASSGNRDPKNSMNTNKPVQDHISYYPFNPSMLTSQEIKSQDPNDKLLSQFDAKEQIMIMELIQNSQNDIASHNFGSSQSFNNSKNLSINYKIPELTKISTKPYELNEDDMHEIPEENENENDIETGSQVHADSIKLPQLQPKNSGVMSDIDDLFNEPPVLNRTNHTLKLNNSKQINKLDMGLFEDLQGKNKQLYSLIDFDQKEESKIEQKALQDLDIQNVQPMQEFDFKLEELEDMGEIIDIGFDEDIDPDSYLKNFSKVNTNQQIKGQQTKSPAKSQEVEESKNNKMMSDFSGTPVHMNSDPNSILQDRSNKTDEIMIKNAPDYALNLNLKKTKSHIILNSEINFSGSNNIENLNNQQKDQILLHLLKERGSIEEKLRIAESELNIRQDHIERMKRGDTVLPIDMKEARLHLAFMFSSPLIRRTVLSIENIMQLDYSTEIDDILKVCSNRDYELKYKIDVATVSNLRSTITD